MSHRCHAFRCEKEIDPSLLMCLKHWRMVPRNIQEDIWRHYRVGQEIDKRPTSEYLKTQQLAVAAVIVAESGVPMDDAINVLENILTKNKSQRRDEMKAIEVKYMRRFTTDVQYEFEEYYVTSSVQEEGEVASALAQIKADIEAAHAGEVPPVMEEKPAKGKKPKATKPVEEEEEIEEETDENDVDSENASESEEETEEEIDEEEVEDTPPKKTGKAATKTAPGSGTKKFKKKPQVYQRSNEAHKEIYSNLMRAVAPDWKKSFESKAKAKKVSIKMEGTDFLDEDGKVFPSFKELVRKAMGGKK